MEYRSDQIATDIEGYLTKHQNKDMLRFITCGSVDDGKSTLIGRLLYESKMIFEDQLEALVTVNRAWNKRNSHYEILSVTRADYGKSSLELMTAQFVNLCLYKWWRTAKKIRSLQQEKGQNKLCMFLKGGCV